MISSLLTYLGAVMPGLVALTLSIGLVGRVELLNLVKRLNPLRSKPRCYVFAVLIPLAALFIGAFFNILDTGSSFALAEPWPWTKWFFTSLFISPLWEELGWRGFLLPRLQATRTGFHASMIIAPIWGIWHLPLKYLESTVATQSVHFLPFFCVFCVAVSGLSIILTWLNNISHGSIVPCIIFHAVFNAVSPYMVEFPAAKDGIMPIVWSTITICLAATILLFLNGENLGRPTELPIPAQVETLE
jgi:membrane protease YdiL (CAAX protease family)